MPSEKFTIKGWCGRELYGKTWNQGSSVECDHEEVKITTYPKLEPGFIPYKVCAFCHSRDETKLRSTVDKQSKRID